MLFKKTKNGRLGPASSGLRSFTASSIDIYFQKSNEFSKPGKFGEVPEIN
jgi:hypothetical protein